MKKIICFGLCFMIILCSFAFCFADSAYPIILPVSDSASTSGYPVDVTGGTTWYFSSDSSPVYITFYQNTNGNNNVMFFSDNPGAIVYQYSSFSGSSFTYNLNSEYNGYYYSYTSGSVPDDIIIGVFNSPSAVIDFVDNSVFSTTFDLTYIVNGSISWLSTFAQAVKNSPLLLFFVIFIFVGIGIGLLNRFARR